MCHHIPREIRNTTTTVRFQRNLSQLKCHKIRFIANKITATILDLIRFDSLVDFRVHDVAKLVVLFVQEDGPTWEGDPAGLVIVVLVAIADQRRGGLLDHVRVRRHHLDAGLHVGPAEIDVVFQIQAQLQRPKLRFQRFLADFYLPLM